MSRNLFQPVLGLTLSLLLGACQSSGLNFGEDPKQELTANSTTDDGENSMELIIAETSDSQLRIMDRYHVKSTLDEIFGPSIATITTARIENAVSEFGGPCDSYKVANGCPVGGSTQFPIVATSIPAREALRTRSCDQIVANDTALLYAIKLVRSSAASLASLTPPTADEMNAAYQLFYTGKELPSTIRSELETIVTTAESQTPAFPKSESWRFLLLSLCLASDWQVP